MRNAGLDEPQAGIKIAGEISITSDIPMHTHCEYFTLNENLDKHNILHEVASFSL